MKRSFLSVLITLFILFSVIAFAQDADTAHHQHQGNPTPAEKPEDDMQDMPGMQHGSEHAADGVH